MTALLEPLEPLKPLEPLEREHLAHRQRSDSDRRVSKRSSADTIAA